MIKSKRDKRLLILSLVIILMTACYLLQDKFEQWYQYHTKPIVPNAEVSDASVPAPVVVNVPLPVTRSISDVDTELIQRVGKLSQATHQLEYDRLNNELLEIKHIERMRELEYERTKWAFDREKAQTIAPEMVQQPLNSDRIIVTADPALDHDLIREEPAKDWLDVEQKDTTDAFSQRYTSLQLLGINNQQMSIVSIDDQIVQLGKGEYYHGLFVEKVSFEGGMIVLKDEGKQYIFTLELPINTRAKSASYCGQEC